MKKVYYLLVLCILLGLSIPAIGMHIGMNENTNPIDSVKQFTGNQKMELKVCGYEYTPHAEYVVIFAENTEYWVNADTNRVERLSSYEDLDDCNRVLVTEEEARLIAESFIRAHDEHGKFSDLSLVMNELNDGGDIRTYEFLWREYIGDVESFNFVFVSVNPTSGAIIHYIYINRPITTSLETKITQEEAELIAIDQFPGIQGEHIDSRLKIGYDEKGVQRLIWECIVTGQPKGYISQGGAVHIDAHTGEIVQIDILM
jgi:predicted small secreted protein